MKAKISNRQIHANPHIKSGFTHRLRVGIRRGMNPKGVGSAAGDARIFGRGLTTLLAFLLEFLILIFKKRGAEDAF